MVPARTGRREGRDHAPPLRDRPHELRLPLLRELDPPRRLAFLWGGDLLRFELEPDGDGTRLTLVHVLLDEGADAAARTAAGWHVCLAALERTLAGRAAAAPDGPSPEWRERYAEYVALGFPAGAPVPDPAETPAS